MTKDPGSTAPENCESHGARGSKSAGPGRSTTEAKSAARQRAAVHYAIRGDLRYLSHHDELRMLTRALIRARWPLAWSEGFNPQPRVNVVLPRRVGTASECQLAIVDLSGLHESGALLAQLTATLPSGCVAIGVDAAIGPGTPHPVSAVYAVELGGDDAQTASKAMESILAHAQLEVTRESGPDRPPRTIDIRRFVEAIWMEGDVLYMRLTFDGQQSARPSEVTTCMGLAPERTEHRVRRVEVRWDKDWTAASPDAGVRERNTLGEEEDGALDDDARSAEVRGKEDN